MPLVEPSKPELPPNVLTPALPLRISCGCAFDNEGAWIEKCALATLRDSNHLEFVVLELARALTGLRRALEGKVRSVLKSNVPLKEGAP